jgi:class 3 adenylate cyclase/predicted ATPase
MDIEAWLGALGLECYAQTLREHDVDLQTLGKLTPKDLSALGITSVGHRRLLLHAIATSGTSAPRPTRPATPTRPGSMTTAEHRRLTVLFCDMVGSTALSTRLDPEDMRRVIRSYHGACIGIAKHYGGYVANFIGDGLLVYFGWPQAHEDDAERAVRAGLELVDAVSALTAPTGEALAARVGVATGLVVVGDLIREGPAQEQSAVGATPNLAGELQALAAPGQVVVDRSTCKLLGTGFVIDSLGAAASAGDADTLEAFAVRGERLTRGRFDARSAVVLPPMIGRDQDVAALTAHWNRAVSGNGQAVLLVGEAGIGKSRLCRALLERIAARPHYRIRYQCSSHHSDSALWPAIHHLERLAKLRQDDSLDARIDRLESLVDGDTNAARMLSALVELDGSARYGSLDISPRERRERTLEVLVNELLRLASQRPVIFQLEDAHWADPTTLELVERCLERIGGASVMVLLSSRPENEPKLGVHLRLSRLLLQRLSRSDVEAIVHGISHGQLTAGTVNTIVDRTDGVPLFAEEITRATLEAGSTAVPASLYGSLMARLDRIPDVKQVAQIAACIGREFDTALLTAAGDWSPSEVSRAIEGLLSAQLVVHVSDRRQDTYRFKHALLQEAAYESLLRSKRRQLHARVLQALDDRQPPSPPELLAHHAAHAGLVDKAVAQWGLAGMLALGKSAYVEAANYLGSAIAQLRSHDAPVADSRARELRLQVALGQARMATYGYGAQITRQTFERARELLDINQDATLRISVIYGLWVGHMMAVGTHQASQMAADLLNAGQADDDEQTLLVAHRLAGSTCLESGDWARATSHLEQALTIYDKDVARFSNLSALYGMDPGASACSNLAVAVHVAGFPARALALAARVRSMAENVSQAIARAPMYCECVNLAILQRDTAWMARDGELFTKLATENGLAMWRAYAVGMQAWRVLDSGRPAEAIEGFRRCIAELTACCAHVRIQLYQVGLATALGGSGHAAEAIAMIDTALAESARSGRGWFDAEMWRVRAELAMHAASRCDDAQIVDAFQRSISIAREQRARAWELRSSVGLARYWARQGRQRQARDLLAPVHASFTEGFDTVDLLEARAVLGSLATA